MSQNQLQTARELIEDRHYSAARKLLESMPDDPTARKWLRQLKRRERQVQPPIPAPDMPALRPARQRSDAWMWIVSALVIIGVIAAIGYTLWSENEQSRRGAAEYACGLMYERYSTQWQNCVNDR